MRVLVHLLLTLFWLMPAGGVPVVAADSFTLDAVRERVTRDYADVEQLSTEAFAKAAGEGERVLLLDVREREEFAVSRIPGAIQVEPGIWRWSFLSRFAEQARGKTVIFYCSVGVRSSKLASAVQAALKEKGALRVYNLDGGIFAWHNEARALVNDKGATPHVHPFDDHWGKLVKRSELIRQEPER